MKDSSMPTTLKEDGFFKCTSNPQFTLVQVERLMDAYLGLYDIVLTGDGDMSTINQLLQFVLQT